MLKIRKGQMDALAAEMALTFVERVEAYLRQAFPEWCAELGEAGLRSFVRHGVGRAEGYELRTEFEVFRYLGAMRELGMRFDESGSHGWAGELLRRRMAPGEKLDRLEDAVYMQKEAERIRNGN